MTADPIAELLAGVARADRECFRRLYSETGGKLFGVCLRILGNRSEAVDALKEVFARAWQDARRFDASKGDGMVWLVAIARDHAIDRLRARPARATDGAAPPDRAEVLPDSEAPAAKGAARRLADCLELIDPARSAALRSAYLSGLSTEALAHHQDVPLDTMRSWLRQGLAKLKECMEA
ncbi:sigma-70 family RNA polymerase sigma factor [Defluviimonas sp. WL0024]|uniref:Sigma-70 family RNA polymerase sigma factor n=1 Tax=Albidovulum salinarum TaxID=2984153 RepID=A0ABT2X714_9RHOB|nr:sigma-70 family RNA polymerase sigma factor [Defluviimonas sp. WL0024]MCU9849738.1 sigma-70 family RNA polymerase sigma factor [Defluviimonas sp. WL0024]